MGFLFRCPNQVINWRSTLRIPPQARLSAEVSDMIVQLCRDPDDRLGANGADEIKAHAFFRGADFSGDPRQQPAPYVPTIAHATDTSNFDPVHPDKRWSSGSDGEGGPGGGGGPGGLNGRHPEHAFYEFTFRRFFDDNGHPYSCPKPIQDQEQEDQDQEEDQEQEEERDPREEATARGGPTQAVASASRDLVYV